MGDGEFVQSVLKRCHEDYSRRQRRLAQGVDLKTLSHGVADYLDLSDDRLFTPGRYPAVVQARSVLYFLAVGELGSTAADLARQTGLTQPAISMSVKRGAVIVRKE